MQRAEVRVLEEVDEEGLGGLLQGLDGVRLPPQFGADLGGEQVQRDLAHEARKGQLAQQQVVGALVAADLLEGEGAGLVAPALALRGGIAGCVARC